MNKVGKTVRLIVIASIAGIWMLLYALFVQALAPAPLAHEIERVLATRPAPAEAAATVAIINLSGSASGSFGK